MGFFSKIFKDVKNVVENPIVDTALGVGGSLLFGPELGAAVLGGDASAAASGAVGDALIGGATGALGGGVTGGLEGAALGGLGGFTEGGGFNDVLSGLGLSGDATGVGAQIPVGTNAGDSAYSLGSASAPVSGGITGPSDALTGPWDQNGFGGVDAAGNPVPVAGTPGAAGSNVATGLPGATAGAGGAPALTGAAPAGAGGSGFASTLQKLGIGPMQGLAIAGTGLNALKGDRKTGADKAQAGLAGQESAEGTNLINLGNAGQLTPGQQATMQQQLNDAITTIKSNYAQQGMSGSSAEANAIGQAQQQFAAQISQLAQGEISTGMQALGMGSQAEQAIANQQVQQDKSLYDSIIALAGSSAGGAQKNNNQQQTATA